MYYSNNLLTESGENIVLVNAATSSPISLIIKNTNEENINSINVKIENSDKSKNMSSTINLQEPLAQNEYITQDNKGKWIERHSDKDIICNEEQINSLNNILDSIPFDTTTYISNTDDLKVNFEIKIYEEISEEFKERLLNGKITRAYIKVLATNTKSEMIIDESNYLKNLKIEDLRYVPDEGFIGGTVSKRITGNFNNVDENFSIQDREIEVYLGVDMSDDAENPQTEYIKYGNYLIQRPEDDQVTDNTTFTALDYMVKANITYKDRVLYPCKLIDLFYDVVDQCGLKTTVTSFYNDDFDVEDNQFEEGTQCRDVLKAIAQVAFNWIRIDQDNNVVMDFKMKDDVTETLSIDEYYNLTKNDEFGPINTIILKNSQVEGENVTLEDSDSVNEPMGKNICPNSWIKGNYDTEDGNPSIYYNRIRSRWKAKVQPNTKYYLNTFNNNYKFAITTYESDETFSRNITSTEEFTTNENETLIGITIYDINESDETTENIIRLVEDATIKPFICLDSEENKEYEEFSPRGQIALTISDNPFAYTQSKRSQLIQAGANLFGLRYTPLTLDTIGYIYLNCIDKIKVENLNGQSFETYLFDHTIDYEGTVSDNMSSIAMTQTETKYQYQSQVSAELKRTEIIVNKQEQQITAISSRQNSFSNLISQLIIDIDGIESTVQAQYDFETSVSGTNELFLEDALPTNILKFRAVSENVKGGIYPSSTLFPSPDLYPKRGGTLLTILVRTYSRYITPEPIYPSNSLFPSPDLYPKPSVYETKEYPIYVGKPMHSALGKSDELLVEYNEDESICIAKIIRYIDYNDGDYRLYDEPQEEIVKKLDIELFEGKNYISIKEFTDWEMEATYLFNNELNKEFATKVETSTQIRQTADEINLEVSKKVDGDKIISSINLSPEQIAIESSKIALEGYTTINGNFSVDEYGNMSCIDAKIGGDFYQYDEDRNLSLSIHDNKIDFYDFSSNNEKKLGSVASVIVSGGGESLKGINLYCKGGYSLYLGYKENESANTIKTIFSFDSTNENATPWIKNTSSGTIFNDTGGIVVENGLIKSWSLPGTYGTLFNGAGGIEVRDGLITSWNMNTIDGEFTVDGTTFVIRGGLIVNSYSNKISTMSLNSKDENSIVTNKSNEHINKPDKFNKEKIVGQEKEITEDKDNKENKDEEEK